jgi:hypothetical protein
MDLVANRDVLGLRRCRALTRHQSVDNRSEYYSRLWNFSIARAMIRVGLFSIHKFQSVDDSLWSRIFSSVGISHSFMQQLYLRMYTHIALLPQYQYIPSVILM